VEITIEPAGCPGALFKLPESSLWYGGRMSFPGIPDVVWVLGSFFKSNGLWARSWRGSRGTTLVLELEVSLDRTRTEVDSEGPGGVVVEGATGTAGVDSWERMA